MAAPAEALPELREGERAERAEQTEPAAEQGADRPEQGADRPEQGADRPERSADRPEQGADRPEPAAEQGADRPEQGADRPERSADRPERSADRPAELPRVREHRGRFLVWCPSAARQLREKHRVWGALVGAPPRRGRAAAAGTAGAAVGVGAAGVGAAGVGPAGATGVGAAGPAGVGAAGAGAAAVGAAGPRLPLELRREEVEVLRESGGAAVERVDEDETEPDETPRGPCRPSPRRARRSRVFRALWGRGCHLTAGGKFGGDFLVYPGPPSQFHAGAVAQCPCSSLPQPLGALLAAARLGTSVRKALLLCSSEPPGGALRCTALQWRADLT